MILHERIKAAVEQRLTLAQAATPGPWMHVDYAGSGDPDCTFMGCGSVITMGENVLGGAIAAPSGDLYPRSGYSPKDDMAFIADNGPDRIIRDCTEDLWLLNEHALDPNSSHLFCDPGCVGGDCKRCGMEYPCRQLRSLARRYDIPTKDGANG